MIENVIKQDIPDFPNDGRNLYVKTKRTNSYKNLGSTHRENNLQSSLINLYEQYLKCQEIAIKADGYTYTPSELYCDLSGFPIIYYSGVGVKEIHLGNQTKIEGKLKL